MNKYSELSKNFLIILLGKFCTQFISFLLIPLYTKYLITADYGYIDLVQTYISLIIPILILRFDSAIFRFLIDVRFDEKNKSKIISSSIFLMVFQIIIFTILVIIVSKFLNIRYLYLIVLNIIFMSISSVFLQLSRGVGDNVNYSIASIISALVTVVLNIILIVCMKMNGSAILISSAIANCVCTIFLVYKLKILKYFNIKYINRLTLNEMVKYSLPMIPDGLSWWIINVSDRSIITIAIDMAANGIYAVSSKISNILSSIFQIFNMSWQESASLHINDEDKETFFSNILNLIYKLCFSMCILIMAVVPIFFKLFIDIKYYKSMLFIPILLLGNLFSSLASVLGGIYIAKKNTKKVAKSTMTSALINILINIFLIKNIGLWAAAISTMISYLILTIYRYIDVQKYFKVKFNFKVILYSLLIFIIIIKLYYYNILMIQIANIIISIICSILLNWKMLKVFYDKYFKKLHLIKNRKRD